MNARLAVETIPWNRWRAARAVGVWTLLLVALLGLWAWLNFAAAIAIVFLTMAIRGLTAGELGWVLVTIREDAAPPGVEGVAFVRISEIERVYVNSNGLTWMVMRSGGSLPIVVPQGDLGNCLKPLIRFEA